MGDGGKHKQERHADDAARERQPVNEQRRKPRERADRPNKAG